MKVLSPVDGPMLLAYVDNFMVAEEAKKLFEEEGVTLQCDRRHPAVGIHNAASAACVKILMEFGLSPSSRGRVQVISEDEDDGFDAWISKYG